MSHNSIANDLVRWIKKNRVHRYRNDMPRKSNELIASLSAKHSREIEAILRKHYSKATVDGYWKHSRTSKDGWEQVQVRAGSQRARLLRAYADAGDGGLTNHEAGVAADLLNSCYWKRCSELKEAGYIASNEKERVNPATGSKQSVCVLTPAGLKKVREIDAT